MAELIVVTGPPGAGKSTVAEILAEQFPPSGLMTGDSFFGFLRQGAIRPWLPAAEQQNRIVLESAAAAAGRMVSGGYTVVYDGVLGPWSLQDFARTAGVPTLHYAVLMPPERICVDRVRDRVGHGFADADATRHMHRDFASALIEPRHLVDNGSDRPADVAADILDRVRAGSLAYDRR